MALHISTTICEKISQDFFGNFSYLTCFDSVNATSLPTKIKNISLASLWFNASNKIDKLKFRVELIRPDGDKNFIGNEIFEADINPYSSHRANLILDGMPIDQLGVYWFKIHALTGKKEGVVAELPLVLKKVEVAKR